MNIYVWKCIDHATGNYHSGGGLVVIAANEERARALANAYEDVRLKPEEQPDMVLALADSAAESVTVFPDAGCC